MMTTDQMDDLEVLGAHATFGEIDPSSATCQRWDGRKHSWVRRRDGGFDSRRYTVEPVTEAVARDYVLAHHYAGTYPAASKRYGLFLHRGDGPELVGVAVFGIPAQARVLTNVFPTLVAYEQSLELSRFVLASDPPGTAPALVRAPANAESWFLARCFEHLAAADVRGVVSFADPVPRVVDGRVLFPGHVGGIYAASGARFTGRGTARSLVVLRDGSSLSARSLQKVRAGERGMDYVVRRLVDLGARPLRDGSNGALWLPQALDEVGAVRIRHRGCLRYAMVTSRRDRRADLIAPAGLPYPKVVDAA